MKIQVSCPKCSKSFAIPSDLRGKKVTCNKCNFTWRVSSNASAPPPVKPPPIKGPSQGRPTLTSGNPVGSNSLNLWLIGSAGLLGLLCLAVFVGFFVFSGDPVSSAAASNNNQQERQGQASPTRPVVPPPEPKPEPTRRPEPQPEPTREPEPQPGTDATTRASAGTDAGT